MTRRRGCTTSHLPSPSKPSPSLTPPPPPQLSSLLVLLLLPLTSSFNLPTPLPFLAKTGATAALITALTVPSLSTPAPAFASPSSMMAPITVAEQVTRQGVYKDYTAETDQVYDNAASTFKPKAETKKKKGKYTAFIGVLVVGSFVIPMAQYFWYVKDDSSSDDFFEKQTVKKGRGKKAPEPVAPPKKKGLFGR